MTHRSGLLAVLAVVLVVLGFTTRAPAPRRQIPITDDRSGTVLAAHLPALHSAPRLPGSRPEATGSEQGRTASLASAGVNTQAVELLERTLAANPNDAESHYQLGQALVLLDRSNDAITHYERAVTIDPSRGDYHFRLGKALHQRGQDERAVKAYQMSIDLDTSDPAPQLSLGVSYEGLGRWNDAVGAYRRYLDLAPASPTTTALTWHVVAIMENQERARAGG